MISLIKSKLIKLIMTVSKILKHEPHGLDFEITERLTHWSEAL